MIKQIPNFSNYKISDDGKLYKLDDSEIKPFKSNDYLQVCLFDDGHNKHIYNVHQVIAMAFCEDYFKGCVVHHIDENKHNNCANNLKVYSRFEHSRMHCDKNILAEYTRLNGPANKGKKMSKEFCEKCRHSASKRGFNGNQFIDKYGNPRQ